MLSVQAQTVTLEDVIHQERHEQMRAHQSVREARGLAEVAVALAANERQQSQPHRRSHLGECESFALQK